MKNNNFKNRIRNKRLREKISKMVNSEDEFENFKKYMNNGISSEEFTIIMEVIRESRLNGLFSDLKIDEAKLKKAKRKVIKLSPESSQFPLMSELYQNHNGKYIVEDLMNEYHDSILRDGMIIGMDYGKKFIVEDLQNSRFTRKDIEEMPTEKIHEYCEEIRKEI
jgi:hypothetical protein